MRRAQPPATHARLLAAGVEPTLTGIRGYLESLLAPAFDKQVDDWIADLGDPQFDVRERASLRLANLDFVPSQKLEAAASSPDPERAWRATPIVNGGRAEASPLLAALRLVGEQKLAVGVPLLLQIRSRTTSPTLQVAALRAMLAIVAESDRTTLVELEKSNDQGGPLSPAAYCPGWMARQSSRWQSAKRSMR